MLFYVHSTVGSPPCAPVVSLTGWRTVAGAAPELHPCLPRPRRSPAGPPWPHLALLLLLLLGSRAHWLAALALLVAGSGLATLHARGLRLVLRLDGVGRLGVALIRHGAPVPGLGQGERGACVGGSPRARCARCDCEFVEEGRLCGRCPGL